MRRLALSISLLIGAGSTALGATPQKGVLVQARFAPGLARAVDRALAEAHLADAIGPAELGARLAEKEPVRLARNKAEQLLSKTAQAALFMRRSEAVSSARSAVAELATVGAAHHLPTLWARANAELGLALLLKPVDEQGATQAFVAALSAQPKLELDRDRSSPRVKELLDKARKQAAAALPGPDALGRVADLAGLSRLLWLGARADGTLDLIDYDAKERRVLSHRRERASQGKLPQVAGTLLVSTLSPPASAPASLVASQPTSPEVAAPRPWYGRWWVWALAATVVAGATVGIVLGTRDTNSGPTTGYDVEWSF